MNGRVAQPGQSLRLCHVCTDHQILRLYESRSWSVCPASRVWNGEITEVLGVPDYKVCTSYVERQNLTLRMKIARFHRLTLAFSKKLINLKAAITGELECDERYFGGRRRRIARGRAPGRKVVVFGILERQGRVSTVVVPRVDEATLMAEMQRRALKGAVFYTDRFKSDQSVKRYGKHLPIDHRVEYVRPGRKYQRHINGIEGFWSSAKERFRKYHGVSRQYFPLSLKEMEFRFNHRRDDLFELVGTQLVRVLFAYPIRYSL